ncbi:MAG: RNA methyltransferase [Bacteroidia bacterium]|nr:RNA methyltransferase [Bacteroidia bacterium]HQV00408.1 RNA methyltransferase [Bacteroidia bacterium]
MNNEKTPNDALQRKTIDEFKTAKKTPVIIILDNVRSAINVGSIFRTADAFLIEAVYLCGITAQPPHKEILKSALGATDTVKWMWFENVADAIMHAQQNGFLVYAVEQTQQSILLNNFKHVENRPIAVIFGHEVTGVSQEAINLCQACIEVPQQGHKHSLNISVCCGIVLWHLCHQVFPNKS